MLPFTAEQFLGVFGEYNLAVWPMQILLVLLALAAVVLVFKRITYSDKGVALILGALWLWTGIVYHVIFFTAINPAAYLFGALFIIQGGLLLLAGLRSKLQFEFKPDTYGITGAILVAYGLLIYPALNYTFGHWFPNNPTFGLPCPVVIFTFGLLLMTKKMPRYLLIIPLLWSLLGISAAVTLGIWEDIGLIVAGVGGTAMLLYRDWRRVAKSPASN